MCDVGKYEKVYEEIVTLTPEDTLQLMMEAKTKEQRDFYAMIGDYILQTRQKQVIKEKLF